jgi:DNA-binding XRE family transcriptional regulator
LPDAGGGNRRKVGVHPISKSEKERTQSVKSRLLRYRLKALMTQEDLARVSGVSRKTIQNIERGTHVPSGLTRFRIARVFDVEPEELFGPLEEEKE